MALHTSAVRGLALLAGALTLAVVHLPGRPSTLCTLRALTGVPCPLCGGTTAAVHLGRADLLGALRASPLAVLGALAFALGPLRPLSRPSRLHLWASIVVVAATSELWQLSRYGFL